VRETIYRDDAIKAMRECFQLLARPRVTAIKAINAIPSADRPSEIIYGNEHNCIMTIFGECSYSETGCGDCAVVEKVRKALSADRPQGEWIDRGMRVPSSWVKKCSLCGHETDTWRWCNFCPNCGARMKGADDELV
jgi:hypothetical protein